MNSGLPYLIEAIYGKKDLDSVSLEEMYEVIQEFPSFNVAHFLLSKKLAHQQAASFEKESMRTSLYFNNSLWLFSLLDDAKQSSLPVQTVTAEMVDTPEIIPALIPIEESFPVDKDSPVVEVFPSDETASSEPGADKIISTDIVTSFDELMSKYKIETPDEIVEGNAVFQEEIHQISDSVPENPGRIPDETDMAVTNQETIEIPVQANEAALTEEDEDDIVWNDYGIFEETPAKPRDHDQEAFDRPFASHASSKENNQTANAQIEIPEAEVENIIENAQTGFDNSETESGDISENRSSVKLPEKSDESDYDAFDRPRENAEPVFVAEESEILSVTDNTEAEFEANDTNPVFASTGEDLPVDEQLQNLVTRFGESQRAFPAFDAKKAEAIVFTPYHMIDYFASQGIKLVLEDQPVDSFGKQLKSFTDWLKVMKKLPVQPAIEAQQDKEADRIRNFAAHSVEERDILTESMAEVLAKQGMYENAIALFQKLSLIYPPKSAYFASRIEQLKASLP